MLPVRGPVGTSGRYILGERLEGGGVSEVYRAEPVEAQFDGPIVLKRMPAALASVPDFIASFVDEARLAMRLDHPHIAKVHDFVASEEGVFLVMEMVDGPDLQAILRHYGKLGRALPSEVAAYIACQALDALDYAHRMSGADGEPLGIVHRGIAPDTIALTRGGQVKLMDFGVARLAALGRTSDPAMPKRDLGYLSAEQIRGEPIDGRCDVWAMGIVLAEMLMGTRLFSAEDDVELLLMVRRGDLSRLDAHGEHIPRPLEAIVRKALAVDLEQRYPSARAFHDALESYLASNRRRMSGVPVVDQVRDLERQVAAVAAAPRARASTGGSAPLGRIQLAKASPPAGVRAISDDDKPAPRTLPRAQTSPPEGPLTPGRVVDILCSIVRDRRTGVLVLQREELVKRAWFHDGSPVFVASNVTEDRFGEFLVRRGVLARAQLDDVLAVLDRYQGRMGQALVSLGLLEPVDAIRLLAAQVSAKLVAACAWQDGTYEFRDGERNPWPALTLELDTHAIVGKALSCLPVDRLEAWAARVEDSRAELEAGKLGAFGFDATSVDRLAALAAGRDTLGSMIGRLPTPERLHLTAIAYVLWRCGLLRLGA
jgi:serine/threonine protein kinase